jgi:hypothetical protein
MRHPFISYHSITIVYCVVYYAAGSSPLYNQRNYVMFFTASAKAHRQIPHIVGDNPRTIWTSKR